MNETPGPKEVRADRRHRYPEELKEKVLAALASGEVTQEEAAEKFKVNLHTVGSWRAEQIRGKSLHRATGRPKGRPVKMAPASASELTRLRGRVMELEHEVGVLQGVIVDQVLEIKRLKVGAK